MPEKGGGTRQVLTPTHLHSAPWQSQQNKGWNSSLDKLARAVDG